MSARRTDSGLDGILLIDKPSGWTSHDVVARARRLTGQRRIGHTGTLDPMATGLLVLCLGRATRVVEYLTGHHKRYTGIVQLGATTPTDDAEGQVLERRPVPPLTAELLERVLSQFRGNITQLPPAYSAVKVGGRRAYDLARKGEAVELKPRPVTIHALQGAITGADSLQVEVNCSAGTYIRSLARDIGEELGCGAHLSALRREAAGSFAITEAITLEALEQAAAAGELDQLIIPMDDGLVDLPAAILGPEGALAMVQGRLWVPMAPPEFAAPCARIYADSGDFVGVGSVADSGEIRASKVVFRQKSR